MNATSLFPPPPLLHQYLLSVGQLGRTYVCHRSPPWERVPLLKMGFVDLVQAGLVDVGEALPPRLSRCLAVGLHASGLVILGRVSPFGDRPFPMILRIPMVVIIGRKGSSPM